MWGWESKLPSGIAFGRSRDLIASLAVFTQSYLFSLPPLCPVSRQSGPLHLCILWNLGWVACWCPDFSPLVLDSEAWFCQLIYHWSAGFSAPSTTVVISQSCDSLSHGYGRVLTGSKLKCAYLSCHLSLGDSQVSFNHCSGKITGN